MVIGLEKDKGGKRTFGDRDEMKSILKELKNEGITRMTRLICRRTRPGRRERDLVQQGMGTSKERVGRREASNIKGPRERGHQQRERASAKGEGISREGQRREGQHREGQHRG